MGVDSSLDDIFVTLVHFALELLLLTKPGLFAEVGIQSGRLLVGGAW